MEINRLSVCGFSLINVFDANLLSDICYTCDTFEATQVQSTGPGSREAYFLTQCNLRKQIIDTVSPILTSISIPYEIRGVELWRDHPGYINPYHYDDVTVQNIMIIYLDSDLENGTGYIENDINYKVPYKKNTGIILLNSTLIYHGMVGVVPDNVIRKTLYVNWLNEKT